MNDIGTKRASIWCERFGKLMEENGYTQESFLKEYKKKYGGGTQANVSRWLGVGRMIKKDGAVAHPLKNKDRSKSQKRLYNFGLLL